jgi:hypothetical protein
VMSQGRVMSQDRSVVSEALDIAQLKLRSGVVRSFFSNLRRFTQIQLYGAGINFVDPDDNLYFLQQRARLYTATTLPISRKNVRLST